VIRWSAGALLTLALGYGLAVNSDGDSVARMGPVSESVPMGFHPEPAATKVLARRREDPFAAIVIVPDEEPAEAVANVGGDGMDEGESAVDDAAAADETVAEAETPTPAPAPALIMKTLDVGPGATLGGLLARLGIGADEAHGAIAALRRLFDPRTLRAGQEVTLAVEEHAEGPRLFSLTLDAGAGREINVARGPEGFAASQSVAQLQPVPARARGVIHDSLYAAAMEAGIPPGVLADMVQIFSYDVDFQREVQPGDGFEIFFERHANAEGRVVREGRIVAAALTLSGQEMRYYWHQPKGEAEGEYFDRKGQSARKPLLKTPIDGARLSSRYGRRDHPILGYTRLHQGIDFAAPAGTPIRAAGDGQVQMAGLNGNYGLYVRLRHNGSLTTAYAHMSRVAVRTGQRLQQGQVVGYVGSSGLSTGPHLHYELHVDNRPVNPLNLRMPTGRKLAGKDMERFLASAADVDERMAATPARTRLASDQRATPTR
jgi:murein DD-endopeptidase MepM/ murein hydrolase activator NlpD